VRIDPEAVIPWDELFEAADCIVCDEPLGELDKLGVSGVHPDCEQRVMREYTRLQQEEEVG
jgi:hypothetical protein